MVVTNLPQIISAMAASSRLIPTLTTIFGVGNMLGRLTSMLPSDWLVFRGGSRLYAVAVINALMVVGHLLFYYAATGVPKDGPLQEILLVVGTFGISYAFGAIWPHLVVRTPTPSCYSRCLLCP